MARMVQFLPWAGLKAEVRVGPVSFWPFEARMREKVVDGATLDHLNRYFASYVDHRGSPVKSLAVACHGDPNFRELSPEEQKQVRAACDMLIFCVIYPQSASAILARNPTMGPASADRFHLMTQCFTPGKEDIAIVAGSLMSGGWKIGDIKFPQPWSMGGPFATPAEDFVAGLSRVWDPGFDVTDRSRLLRSLEWFRMAHTEVDEVSSLSKVVMMATAFEILLDVPNVSRKADWIADRINELCGYEDSIRVTRRVYKRDVTRSQVAWWAWDFYKLRNAVVHGDDVVATQLKYPVADENLKWLTQLIVADLLFGELVTWKLEDHRCLGNEADDFAAGIHEIVKGPEPLSRESAVRFVRGLHEQHRAVEWSPQLAVEGADPED